MIGRLTAKLRPLSGIFVLLQACFMYASRAPEKSAGASECVRYLVGGTRLQAQLSGHYDLLKQTHNNRFVYRQSCSQYALFANSSSDGSTRWVFGRGVGRDVSAYVMSRDSRAYPGDVTSWLAWSRENNTWVYDPGFLVSCADILEPRSCRSFVIRGPDVPPSYRGPYVIDGYHDHHVRYKHADGDYYLFYDDDVTCRRWVVSHVTDDDGVVMQATSHDPVPFAISTQWRAVNYGKLSSKTYSVQLHCQEYEKESAFTCGKRHVSQRAVPYMFGAEVSYPGKWPFMVSYTRADGVHKCGGTLINKRWVITTGHCVSEAKPQWEELRFGAYNLNNLRNETVQTIGIKSVHVHPLFSWVLHPFRLNHDIGLIELADDVTYTDYVQPVCLPPYSDQFPFRETEPLSRESPNDTYTACHMVGWGKTNYTGSVGGQLQEVTISKVMEISECLDIYYNNLSPAMSQASDVCVFGRTGGRMCKGDSGSPLLCQRSGQWYLLGLGGWSLAECIDVYFFYPSVYTDLSVYRDWIFATMHGFT